MKSTTSLLCSAAVCLALTSTSTFAFDNHAEHKKIKPQAPKTLQYDFQYRSAKEKARDKYRHPKQTLHFFGIKPTDNVVEIWPGGGWYTQILAPALKGSGQYIAAHWPKDSSIGFFTKNRAKFDVKFTDHPERYGDISVTGFEPPMHNVLAPDESADVVLTFRNVHNWMSKGYEQDVFNAAYKALRPGGVLGVVEHRAKPDTDRLSMIESGYVTEDYVKDLAQRAGFKFAGSSEINANAKDLKNYPAGVWTLPPTLSFKEQDKAKYLKIGESDRMTLKFIKSKNNSSVMKTEKKQKSDITYTQELDK